MCSTSLLPISPSLSPSRFQFFCHSTLLSTGCAVCRHACVRVWVRMLAASCGFYINCFIWCININSTEKYCVNMRFVLISFSYFIGHVDCSLHGHPPRPFCHNASPLASHIAVDVFQICNYLFTSFLVRLLFFLRWCKWVRDTQKTTSTNTLTVIHKHTINCPNVPMPITIKLPKWKL